MRGPRPMIRLRPRGLSLFGALLALVLIGVMVVAASQFYTAELIRRTERRAVEQLAEVSKAGYEFVLDRFTALVTGPASQEVTLAQLRTASVLAPGFLDVDVMGRGYRVLLMRPSPEVLDLVVTQTFAAGDDESWPWRPLAQVQSPVVRLGTVSADEPTILRGPAINLDVATVQSTFGVPQVRAVAGFARLDRQTVFGDQLYRVAVPGFAELARMETDLDLGGNAIVEAGDVDAVTLTVADTMEVGGHLTVTSDLLVSGLIDVTGAATVAGALEAQTADVANDVSAATVTSDGLLQAASVNVAGALTAGGVSTTGDIAVGGAATVTGTVTASTARAGTVDADALDLSILTADQVRMTSGTARTLGVTDLIVGSCSGC